MTRERFERTVLLTGGTVSLYDDCGEWVLRVVGDGNGGPLRFALGEATKLADMLYEAAEYEGPEREAQDECARLRRLRSAAGEVA